MKKFKKLIPAFCAMLVSAAMLGTSTYAWFSVNKKVEAKGMSVTATPNTQYFVVSANKNFESAKTITLGNNNIVQGGIGSSEDTKTTTVKPAAYGTVKVDESTTKGIANTWWTANVNTYDSNKKADIIGETAVTGEGDAVYANSEFFVGYTFYVGLADKSADFPAGALQVVATASTNAAKVAAVKFEQCEGTEVKAGGNSEIVRVEGAEPDTTSHGIHTTKTYELSAGTTKKYVQVTVYVFIDGNNESIIDSATAALTGTVGVKIGAATENMAA